jgi:UDP-glucose 4-epimerase
MKALITGGAGFVGRYLVKELAKTKVQVIVYDRLAHTSVRDLLPLTKNISYIKGDIQDFSLLKKSMKGCDLVFHTAAIADIDEARKDPIATMDVNVSGTVKCLEAAYRNDVTRFLFASSVYASGNRGSFYSITKRAGESLAKAYYEDFGLKYTILRYGSLYGREPNHWNFIYKVCKELLTKGEFFYTSSPDAIREYIHISDAARETVRIAQDPEYLNRSVLITGHQKLKMSEFFDMIEEILGKKITVHYDRSEHHRHYIRTPYSFDVDVPIRINLSNYIDISEGILDCLKEVKKELMRSNNNEE